MRTVPSRLLWRCLGFVLVLTIAGCYYPSRNVRADLVSETEGYRWAKLIDTSSCDQFGALTPPCDTLVIVTASGGGTRATALALSV